MLPAEVLPRSLSPSDSPLRVAVQGLALVVLFASGLVDLARAVPFGPVTSQAVLTAAYFCSGALLILIVPARTFPIELRYLPLLTFWLWAVSSLAWTSAFREGVQNVLVIGTMLLMFLLSDAIGATEPSFAFWLEKQLLRSVLLAVVVYGFSVLWFGKGTDEVIGARSFGLFALFGVAHNLARWRYGSRAGLFYAIAITLLIGLSESRLSLGIAVVLFPLSQFPTHRFFHTFRAFGVLCLAAICSYSGFLYSETLQMRFFAGDASLRIGDIAINGSGRAALWKATTRSIEESPVFGKGAGSAEALISAQFAELGHPHSDYLRITHDYGAVGVTVWAVAIIVLVAVLWRRWRFLDLRDRGKARIHLTALLALLAFMLEMTVENSLVYVYVTAPLGLIVGSAFGIRLTRRVPGRDFLGQLETAPVSLP
jgi:O-antigen ligase